MTLLKCKSEDHFPRNAQEMYEGNHHVPRLSARPNSGGSMSQPALSRGVKT